MRPRRRTLAPLLLAAVLGTSAVFGTSAGASAAGSAAKPRAAVVDPVTEARPYRLDLADANDFVAQATFVQCVGASMQMMLNIDGANDRSARTQVRLQSIARSLSGPTRAGFERKGASVRGWTDGLNQLDAGPYQMVGADTLADALRQAAIAIRATGRPVGLLVWAGRHAWVMSGFEATADPLRTHRFRVTKAIVLDPLYPYGSARWGRSPRPREAVTPAFLGRQFVPRRRGTWAGAPLGVAGQALAALAGKYVIVMPFTRIVVDRNQPRAI
ncbi:MAG: hypothetical protein QOI00_247 [Chloroflexota bacterium]|jgi:hypothetical protein|nr:hypothetical protein [Chloroflexota bacterium]MEA2605490.1 hypothetical protein [Chloroflexota bacterium]